MYAPNQWDMFRRRDDTIDMMQAWAYSCTDVEPVTEDELKFLKDYFRDVESYQRINSRQAAAICCAQATFILMMRRGNQI